MNWVRINLASPEFDGPAEAPYLCGLIYKGKRHTISGPPETAKTLFALILGLEHMRGGHGGFALIDFEMGERAIRLLLEDLGATKNEIADVYYVAAESAPDADDIQDLADANVTLAVVDAAVGAYHVSGLDDGDRGDAERFGLAWIDPLWTRGIASIVIDHVVKNSEARGKYTIGSERKLGRVDVHLGLETVGKQLHRGGSSIVRVTTHKDRPGHLQRPKAGEVHLASDLDSHQITWSFESAAPDANNGNRGGLRPTYYMDRVVEYLSSQHELVPRTAVTDHIGGKKEWVIRAIDCLVSEKRVSEKAGPRGAKLLALRAAEPAEELFP
jgi:hypothetical protein